MQDIDFENFISCGAEQRVFLKDEKIVQKLTDAIYYATWVHYLINLVLNNYFFPDTAYKLVGFYKNEETLYACVEQPFIKADNKTDLMKVKEFLISNGFVNQKNNDYHHDQ